MLFQASGIHASTSAPPPAPRVISTPALGRVTPLDIEVPIPEAPPQALPPEEPPAPAALPLDPPQDSTFWRLVRLEASEALLLVLLNAFLALLSVLMSGAPLGRTYGELWPFLLPVHACTSWALLMVPLVLAGQSPLMGTLGIRLEASQPELRMSFSLFHLLSVLSFPLSFLCMVLTPAHRTLAELLTGQELVLDARSRMR